MLVAILLVALGTILAAAVAYESAMNARRGSATISFDEALLVGEGAEALAAYGLKAVMDQSKPGPSGTKDVYPSQPWAQPVGPLEVVPGITLEASLEDMQGRFNLNWLVNAQSASNTGAAGQNSATNPFQQQNVGLGQNAGSPTQGVQGGPNPGAVKAFNKLLERVGIEPGEAQYLQRERCGTGCLQYQYELAGRGRTGQDARQRWRLLSAENHLYSADAGPHRPASRGH
jgi:type II secretory pathway component PulK